MLRRQSRKSVVVFVVLDTNVIVSGAMWRGSPASILNAWADSLFEVVASPEILDEYEEILLEVGHKVGKKSFAERWIITLREKVHIVIPEKRVELCRDPEDDKFLACAVAAQAECIVSGDIDLQVLKSVIGIPIYKPADFLARYSNLFK